LRRDESDVIRIVLLVNPFVFEIKVLISPINASTDHDESHEELNAAASTEYFGENLL
jgi:hypothetical protein